MVRVAVAGGTGKLGRAIAEVLSQNPEHETIILSRKATVLPDVKAPVYAVDYANVDSLAGILEKNAIDTVVSTMPVATPEVSAMEIGLVNAASKSGPTKRFIASQWAIPVPDLKLHLPMQGFWKTTIEELEKTDLEWTTIYNGFFMDFFGTPHIKSPMGVFAIHIDMLNKAAAIPGTGNDTVSFTYTYDIAKFVDAALSLSKWEKGLFCYGDLRTYNEILEIAERSRGTKFDIEYDSREKLEKSEMTELPFHTHIYSRMPKAAAQHRFSRFGLSVIKGHYVPPSDGSTLNDRFPEIRTTSVEEMMSAWKGK